MDTPYAHEASWFAQFRKQILAWYRRNHRPLPWRETRDPYAIWVSEIMLQQTQVATVLGYYARFLEQFPTVNDLANADEQQVLNAWAGLGYYRRARQMHAAAIKVRDEFEGVFPSDIEQINALPGIGRYTAGAIASFAFGDRQPILEANTIRLYSRLIMLRSDPSRSSSQSLLWQFAEDILPARGQGRDINQAVMELGSLVCVPQAPNCASCPLAGLCPTYAAGLQTEIPRPKPKKKFHQRTHALVLIRRQGRYLMRCNPEGAWWQGLWDFPRIELPSNTLKLDTRRDPARDSVALEELFESQLGLACHIGDYRHSLKHTVTNNHIDVHCYAGQVERGVRVDRLEGAWQWYQAGAELPLTATASKLVARIAKGEIA